MAGVAHTTEGARTSSSFTLYRFYAADESLLYIGLTINPGQRFVKHAHDKPWWTDVAQITLEQHESHAALVAAEREAIIEEEPRHNVIFNGRPQARPVERLYNGMERGEVVGLAFHNGRYLICQVDDGDQMGVQVIPWMPTNELFAGYPEWVDGSQIARIRTAGLMSVEHKVAEGYAPDDEVYELSGVIGYGKYWADQQRIRELVEEDMETW